MTTFTNLQLIFFIFRLLISGQHTLAAWCVAKNDAPLDALQQGLDYACTNGADCTEIQFGGKCFDPDTLQQHASYAYNSYYLQSPETHDDCDFSGTATFTDINPSHGSCVYIGARPLSMGRETKGMTSPTSGSKWTPPSKNDHDILHGNGDN